MHTVQSNVSGHIKRLERELGVELIDRQTGRLTEEGVAVESAGSGCAGREIAKRLVLSTSAALRAEVKSAASALGMPVCATTARWLVPLLVHTLAMAHPGVRLVTTAATSSALGALLAAGGLDCAVVNLPLSTPELRLRPLFDEGHRPS